MTATDRCADCGHLWTAHAEPFGCTLPMAVGVLPPICRCTETGPPAAADDDRPPVGPGLPDARAVWRWCRDNLDASLVELPTMTACADVLQAVTALSDVVRLLHDRRNWSDPACPQCAGTCGGCECERCHPYNVGALPAVVAQHPMAVLFQCTGVTAMWCPVHGGCTCQPIEGVRDEGPGDDDDCPLHSPESDHAT